MKSAYCSQPCLPEISKFSSPRRGTRLPCRLKSRHQDTTNAAVLPVAASSCRNGCRKVVITYMGGGKCLAIRHIAYGCRCFGSRDTVDAAANACRCAVRNMSVVSHSFLHLSESESKIVWENNTHNW